MQISDEPKYTDEGKIVLPTGNMSLKELMNVLNHLPVEIAFVDKDKKVRYYSDNYHRIFLRTPAAIGLDVRKCHPHQSLDRVEAILNSFKEGKKDIAEFWLDLKGSKIHICYYAVRDEKKEFLGTLEVIHDITALQKLTGEKRIQDWTD